MALFWRCGLATGSCPLANFYHGGVAQQRGLVLSPLFNRGGVASQLRGLVPLVAWQRGLVPLVDCQYLDGVA